MHPHHKVYKHIYVYCEDTALSHDTHGNYVSVCHVYITIYQPLHSKQICLLILCPYFRPILSQYCSCSTQEFPWSPFRWYWQNELMISRHIHQSKRKTFCFDVTCCLKHTNEHRYTIKGVCTLSKGIQFLLATCNLPRFSSFAGYNYCITLICVVILTWRFRFTAYGSCCTWPYYAVVLITRCWKAARNG